jgi:hypothetical protein
VPLDPQATRAYARRWRIFRAAGRSELRAMSMQEKARRLAALMASATLFDRRHLDAEDSVARRRWARLQRLHRAQS